ncbi:bifunctional folylpolyglutamate synthase/dihydrofolate synthase [Roseibacillus ishigakijimensis]|uniref:Dihydrofolate synthase/folylpolyglutamate synthase n=1 Tax=Roseibacillus ishigakijimensis TaxID=454146 RepID=A0A934VL14_9BACT|nr:folylpolyglutamate synthase/dihydrofolate synthase family protein [Roseibacillus ishigakijimensis]MBK1832651.1 bifunctional folylpolyglutamate synthase/dihydrofolate synthase [Roseibacillus ishigakijimensis]
MTYSEALDWLYATQNFGIKLGLENPTRLLREYLAFPRHGTRVIQVAGTNGKGSTCAFIDSLARATGARTGLFTSPHLVSYRERIQVSGQQIPEEDVARGLTRLREIVADWENHPTFFELTLALAMRHFYERDCELIILEVGMGGRYDATTAVPADATVLTPVDLDHQQWLGETLAEIAGEKAAIFREGKPALVAKQEAEAIPVIEQTANQTRSPLTWVPEPLLGYPLGLAGPHQSHNAALALEAIHSVGFRLSYDTVLEGLQKARHPGRFEITEKDHQVTVFDIAHNPHATKSLVATWQERFPAIRPALIFGAAGSKDIATMLALYADWVDQIHFTPINSPRSTPVADLQAALPGEAASRVHLHQNVADALKACAEKSHVLLTGSAFLVGEAKALLSAQPHQSTSQ